MWNTIVLGNFVLHSSSAFFLSFSSPGRRFFRSSERDGSKLKWGANRRISLEGFTAIIRVKQSINGVPGLSHWQPIPAELESPSPIPLFFLLSSRRLLATSDFLPSVELEINRQQLPAVVLLLASNARHLNRNLILPSILNKMMTTRMVDWKSFKLSCWKEMYLLSAAQFKYFSS